MAYKYSRNDLITNKETPKYDLFIIFTDKLNISIYSTRLKKKALYTIYELNF